MGGLFYFDTPARIKLKGGVSVTEHIYEAYRQGMEFLENGKPAKASVLLEQVKEGEPDKGSVREALGRAYYNCGQFESARHNFAEALRIDPVNDYAHFGLALCLERQGEHKVALGHIKLALAMRPANEAYQRVGLRLDFRGIVSDAPSA